MKATITKRQAQILYLLREYGSAIFIGGTRRFDWFQHPTGGVVIRCYQGPEYFLKHRGLISPRASNAPGHWYALSEAGAALAARIRKLRS